MKRQEALNTLSDIQKTQACLKSRAAKEYAPWFGWGVGVMVLFSPFDVLRPSVWGPVCWVLAFLGWLCTNRYFQHRHRAIKTRRLTAWYAWALYGTWILAGTAAAIVASPHFGYAWTVAGVATGLPLILYGARLKWLFQHE